MASEPAAPSARVQREIFLEALERSIPEERARFLDTACAGDKTLRGCIEQLLQQEPQIGTFMAQPALHRAGRHSGPELELDGAEVGMEQPGDRIGPYTLLEQIGEGGCGAVYRAEQQEPLRRVVALKVLKLGMDTREVIRRVEAERQTLALMDHPNIARIYDAGTTDSGRPFFVMELVPGLKLTSHCEEHRLSTAQRLELFIQICRAIQHAHQKGIIHRDIKPSNILVAIHDGRPVPKVIDFGIAKAIDQPQPARGSYVASLGHFLGTPAYMSPEQMQTGGKDIDTRSDIYSLGVLLYELLTGKPPFSSDALLKYGLEDCRRKVMETQPDRPSTQLTGMVGPELNRIAHQCRSEPRRLVKLVRGDLDWIVMKALEKDRMQRYSSAGDLARDLECYLEDEPVLARPASPFYRLQKLIQRHRVTFGAVAAVLAALLVGTGVSVWQAVSARQAAAEARLAERAEAQLRRQADLERERAREQAGLARLNEYVADINLAHESMNAGNYGRAVQLLKKHVPQPGAPDLRGFEWKYLWNRSLGDAHVAFPAQDHAVRSLATSPTGELLALGTDRELKVWDLQHQALVQTLPEGVLSVCFAAAGNQLIASTAREVLIFDTERWTKKVLPVRSAGPSAISGDGSLLAVVTTEGVQLWSTQNLVPRGMLPGASSPLSFSPDGKLLAAGGQAGITLWDLETLTAQGVLDNSQNLFGGPRWNQLGRVIAFSPDGQFLAAPRNAPWGGFVVETWDRRSRKALAVLPQEGVAGGHTGSIAGMAVSREGILATASMDHSIRLWDLRAGRLMAVLHGHQSEVWTVGFGPDGHTLISGAKDGSVNLWSIPPKPDPGLLVGPYATLAFANDSRTLAVLDRARAAVLFVDPLTRETKRELPLSEVIDRGPPSLAFSADLSLIAEGMRDGTVRFYDGSLKPAGSLQAYPRRVTHVALSPDGRQLVTRSLDRNLLWWDLRSQTNSALASAAHAALFSPDGRSLLLYGSPDGAEMWDSATHSLRFRLGTDHSLGPVAAFSPDGGSVALASDPLAPEQSIQLRDIHTGHLLKTFIGHKQGIASLAFSNDGRTLASSSHDSTLKLWSIPTGQELMSLTGTEHQSWNLRFSPDGTLLTSDRIGPEQGIRFYSARMPAEDQPTAIAAGLSEIP